MRVFDIGMDEKVCKCVWNAQKITQNRLLNGKKIIIIIIRVVF